MKKELDVIVKKIEILQNEVGQATPELKDDEESSASGSQALKALGEKLDHTIEAQTEFLQIAAEMQKQSGNELFKSYSKADLIVKQARKNLADAKKLAAHN